MNIKLPSWSAETAYLNTDSLSLLPGNYCLDFHGNPMNAKLTVFSDGNHHKALHELCQQFLVDNNNTQDVFYITAPPAVILDSVDSGTVQLGNLSLSVKADIFISPPEVITRLAQSKPIDKHKKFSSSKRNCLLIHRDNYKHISGLSDLFRDDVVLALSNPDTETVSHQLYLKSLENYAAFSKREDLLSLLQPRMIYSAAIHHREIPQLIANKSADVSLIYYHLAKSYVDRFPELFALIEYNVDYPDLDQHTDYHCALLNSQSPYAQSFYDFVFSSQGQEIYHRNGLATTTSSIIC